MADPRYSIFAARAVFDPRLTATDVRVLAALGTYSNKQGWCNPKHATIATRVGVSRATVVASMKRLGETGYVQVTHQVLPGRGQTASNYRVILDLEPLSNTLTPAADVDLDDSPMSAKTTARCQPERQADVVPVQQGVSNQDDTQKEHSHKNDTSTLLRARTASFDPELWKARVSQAIELAGPALLPTNPVHKMPTVFRLLCEPVSGDPCDWDLDVLPAIVAASARNARFDKWDYIKPAAIQNRDRRLTGLPAPQAQPIKANGHAPSRGRTDSAAVIARVAAEMGVK